MIMSVKATDFSPPHTVSNTHTGTITATYTHMFVPVTCESVVERRQAPAGTVRKMAAMAMML